MKQVIENTGIGTYRELKLNIGHGEKWKEASINNHLTDLRVVKKNYFF